jgi:hypothetical protein
VLVAEENVDFRIHVENQTRARDDVSRKQLRLYQLYSRTSGKHIQVLGRRISARGEDGDKYGMCQPHAHIDSSLSSPTFSPSSTVSRRASGLPQNPLGLGCLICKMGI